MRYLIFILSLLPLCLLAQKKKDSIPSFVLDSSVVKKKIRTAKAENIPDSLKAWTPVGQVEKTAEVYSKATASQSGAKKKLGEIPVIFDVYEKRVDSTIVARYRPGRDTTFKLAVTLRKLIFSSAIVPEAVLKNPKNFFDNKNILFTIKDE